MAGMYQFVQQGSASRIDREGLVQWASRRFENELTIEDFKNMQRDEIRELLVGESKSQQKHAQDVISNLQTKVDALSEKGAVPLRNGNGEAKSLEDWFKQELNYELDLDDVNRLEKEALEQRLEAIVEDHYHPEMRRMERTGAVGDCRFRLERSLAGDGLLTFRGRYTGLRTARSKSRIQTRRDADV